MRNAASNPMERTGRLCLGTMCVNVDHEWAMVADASENMVVFAGDVLLVILAYNNI